MKTELATLTVAAFAASAVAFDIFPKDEATPPTNAEIVRDQMVQQLDAEDDRFVVVFKALWTSLWEHPHAEPEEVLTAYGEQAYLLFAAADAARAHVLRIAAIPLIDPSDPLAEPDPALLAASVEKLLGGDDKFMTTPETVYFDGQGRASLTPFD